MVLPDPSSVCQEHPSYISIGERPCSPCFCQFSSPTYVIFSTIWGSNPLCSFCNRDVYWWLNVIPVIVKDISWEKCYCCSGNRMWSYQWFTMSSLKPMVVWSLEHFSVWTLNSSVLYNFQRGWESLVWAPYPYLPTGLWFWSRLQWHSLCLWCEKWSTLSLGDTWTMLTSRMADG